MYLPHIFSDGELHLILWRRLNEACHDDGLGLAKRLLAEQDLVGDVMLLLRPYPRASYHHFQTSFAIPDQPFPGSDDDPWCELWVQTSRAAADDVGKRLRAFRTDGMRRCFLQWMGDGGALWGPLSRGIQDCQYAATRPGGAQRWLAELPMNQVAWLLKLIWHRATEEILTHCVTVGGLRLLDPRTDQTDIADVADRALSTFLPAGYGVDTPDEPVEPSAYGVSHLAVGAINAVTINHTSGGRGVYRLEKHYDEYYRRQYPQSPDGGRLATLPHLFDSREQYLESLRAARSHL